MSTKITILHGENYHIYTDYAQPKHLLIMEVNNKKVDLPKKLERELYYIFGIVDNLKTTDNLMARLNDMDKKEV